MPRLPRGSASARSRPAVVRMITMLDPTTEKSRPRSRVRKGRRHTTIPKKKPLSIYLSHHVTCREAAQSTVILLQYSAVVGRDRTTSGRCTSQSHHMIPGKPAKSNRRNHERHELGGCALRCVDLYLHASVRYVHVSYMGRCSSMHGLLYMYVEIHEKLRRIWC